MRKSDASRLMADFSSYLGKAEYLMTEHYTAEHSFLRFALCHVARS